MNRLGLAAAVAATVFALTLRQDISVATAATSTHAKHRRDL